MDFDINYFKIIQNSSPSQAQKLADISLEKANLIDGMRSSINYIDNATRNGIHQEFVVTPSQVSYKYRIEAFPNEQLFVGDIIECLNEKWIIIETRIGNPMQVIGTMWLCNINLNFQNNTSDIICRPAVLDSGVYSTTKNGNEEVQETDKQFKLYLPYDDETSHIFVDKRIAVDTRYNSMNKKILECYEVTGLNRVARSYGVGGHLLIIELRSAHYSPEKDNIEHMICDYIQSTQTTQTTATNLTCIINGRKSIPIGTQRKYTTVFYNDLNEIVDDVTPIWNTSDLPIGITSFVSNNDIFIKVDDNNSLIGQTLILSVTNDTGVYNNSIELEVGC